MSLYPPRICRLFGPYFNGNKFSKFEGVGVIGKTRDRCSILNIGKCGSTRIECRVPGAWGNCITIGGRVWPLRTFLFVIGEIRELYNQQMEDYSISYLGFFGYLRRLHLQISYYHQTRLLPINNLSITTLLEPVSKRACVD